MATLRCAQRDGGGAVSLQAIAVEAGVSKALVLYHYHDKETLLATTLQWLSDRVVQRELHALERSSATSVLEEYWQWLAAELHSGELRALLELTQARGEKVRQTIATSAAQRQAAAERTVARVFLLLDLVPRLPAAMLATCELAFRDGLVVWSSQRPDQNLRVAFDVFWLSLLGLAR